MLNDTPSSSSSATAAEQHSSAPRPTAFNSSVASSADDDELPNIELSIIRERSPAWALDFAESFEGPELDGWPSEVAHGLASLNDDAIMRREIPVTELAAFANCSFDHWVRYELRTGPLPHYRLMQDRNAQIQEEQRGDILHEYLSRHKHSWGPEAVRRGIENSTTFVTNCPPDKRCVDSIEQDVRAYLDSFCYGRVSSALEVRREYPFAWPCDFSEDLELTARADLLYRTNHRWHVVDFKTTRFAAGVDRVDAVLKDIVRYDLQAAMYLYGLRRIMGRHFVGTFTYYYTSARVAVTIRPTDEWIDTWVRRVPILARLIRRQVHNTRPIWGALKCGGCPLFQNICKPDRAELPR